MKIIGCGRRIIIFIRLALLTILLIFNTPGTRVGSGFVNGTGSHVVTYTEIVHEAIFITSEYPKEDDIKAQTIYTDRTNNIPVLKLSQTTNSKERR